jgi:predicted AAA+ superfamily ATPase
MENKNLIPTEKILERLRFENPWWNNKQIPEVYASMSKRLYFREFYAHVIEKNIRRALVLMGPRRVGKTVMLFHSIQELLSEKVNAQKIFFVGIDNPIYVQLTLEDLLDLCKRAMNLDDLNGSFVFFDEIQYLKDWERHLKILVELVVSLILCCLLLLSKSLSTSKTKTISYTTVTFLMETKKFPIV